jgi:hypothetical protein
MSESESIFLACQAAIDRPFYPAPSRLEMIVKESVFAS